MGLLAIDRRPQSYAAFVPRDALDRGEAYALDTFVRAPRFLPGMPGGPDPTWHGLVEELRDYGIETDAESLRALPFEVIGDQEFWDELRWK